MTISEIRNRIDEINNRIAERTNELTEEQNPYIEMDSEIIALNSELTSLNNEMNIAINEVYAYAVNYRKNNLQEDLKDANNRYNVRGEELSRNDVDFTSQFMDQEYNTLSNEINSIQGEIDNLDGYTEMYSETRLGNLEKQLEEANANLEARMNTLAEEGNNYSQMDEEVINLSGQISVLNDSIKKMKEEIKENAYYLRTQELESNLMNANKKIEEKEIELDNNNVSYDERYMDQEYINVCRERDYIQNMIDDLKYKHDNNLLTDEIFNEITLPELTKKTNDNIQTNQKESTNVSTNESVQSKEDEDTNNDIKDNSNEIENQTKEQKEDNSNDVENQIKDLEEKLKACAERMQKAREEGNEQAYAEERSRYSYLTEEINKLKGQLNDNVQKDIKGNSNEKGYNPLTDEEIKKLSVEELKEKLNENARKLEDAFRKGDRKNEEQARRERKKLFDRVMELKKQKNENNSSSNNERDSSNNADSSLNKDNSENNDLDEVEELDLDEDNKKEMTTEEKKKAKIRKAAFGVLGGTIGFGLSFALQPGTVGTVISVGRLVYSGAKKGLKIYTEKHKDDENNKIIKMVGKIKDFTKEQAEKHPKITSTVVKVNNFLKKPETQVFLNGVAAGYTIGKISQFVYKMHEASALEKQGTTNSEVDPKPEKPEKPETHSTRHDPISGQPSPIPDPTPTFDPSKPVDLSSIKNGYVSSYSSDPVSLMTSAGKNAVFDKINVVDGKTWVHFTQGNGAGYAWFPAEDVMDALNISDISELTNNVSGGMHL